MEKLYGGMEGGGTKFVCAVGTGPDEIIDETRFPTTTPDETLDRAIAFFKKHTLAAIGLAPFGPLDLNPASPPSAPLPPHPNPAGATPPSLGDSAALRPSIGFRPGCERGGFRRVPLAPRKPGISIRWSISPSGPASGQGSSSMGRLCMV